MNELMTKSIAELAPLIKNRDISPVELTGASLRQIDTYNPELNCFIDVYAEEAKLNSVKAEKEISQGNYRGDLHGIPMGLKDNIYLKNKITTMGSKIHRDFKPDFNATVVNRLVNAGVTLTGKLNMHEYALGATNNNPHYGACKNPWNTKKIPGGSSGGSASAIAANMSLASIGTDTSGSITIPSSMCGVVGLKPTFGRVSKYGCFPEAWSLDHVGPMGKSVTDVTILLEALAGFDENDPSSVHSPDTNFKKFLTEDVSGMVIGINEDYFFKEVDQTIKQLVYKAINVLENKGAKIELIRLPSLVDADYSLEITDLSELAAVHHYNIKSRPEDFGKDVRKVIELGHIPSAVDYLQAQQIRREIKADFKRAFQKVDVIIAPSVPISTMDIGSDYAEINDKKVSFSEHSSRLAGPVNLAGLPSLTIPCGFKDEMPVGLQIIGPAFGEADIIQMGYAYESIDS